VANLITEYLLSVENSEFNNKDGYGIFVKESGRVFKSDKRPIEMYGMGNFLRQSIKTNDPILSHVRSASATKGVKLLGDTNSHPFYTDKLVLAHNGTLEMKDEKDIGELPKNWDTIIDSEKFLYHLDKEYKDNLPTSLASTMEKWTGKFAFLIYDKGANKYYASNGKTADLYITYLVSVKKEKGADGKDVEISTKLGYLINTTITSLNNAIPVIQGIMQILGEKLLFTYPKELEDNAVFELGATDIEKVGDIKENSKITYTNITVGGSDSNFFSGRNTTHTSEISSIYKKMGTEIQDFLTESELDYKDLDELFMVLYSIPFFGASPHNIRNFTTDAIPYFRKRVFHKLAKLWRDIKTTESGMDFLKENQLQFPYFFNSFRSLQYIYRNLPKKG
jgi:predicted glutamine amidotransferase